MRPRRPIAPVTAHHGLICLLVTVLLAGSLAAPLSLTGPGGAASARSAGPVARQPVIPPAAPTTTPPATPSGEPADSVATPTVGTPAATPGPSFDCVDPCFARFAAGPDTDAALLATGLRASFRSDTAVWVAASPADLGSLVSVGPEPASVRDATPTLGLYAITQRPDTDYADLIAALGATIDQVGTTTIVEAATVPATVVDLTSNGVRVQKVAPGVPASTPLLTAASAAALPPVETIPEAFPDLSNDELTRTISDLAGTGVGPGELGTRFFSLPQNAMAAEYLYLRFAAYGLTVWFEDYVASNGMLSVNVVAEVPGQDDSQISAAFAHFDTIAEDTPGNDIAPGALDNATGVGILLENARLLAGYRLAYPVRFVALNGEEVGLQGSRAFGEFHAAAGTPFVAGINIDAVGTAYGYRVLYVNASPSSAFIQDILVAAYEDNGFSLNIQPRQNPAIVSDEVPLTNAGIPTILVASMLYGDPLINCSCDTIDGVDIDFTRATGRLVLLTLAVLASPAT